MGNTKSFIWTDNGGGNYTSIKKSDSPSPKRNVAPGVIVLNDDPRSPNVCIPRTPIEIQQSNDDSLVAPVMKISSKFSYKEVNSENCNPKDDDLKEDSAFLKSNNGSRIVQTNKEEWQRTPLRDYSKPSLLLRYKQSKQALRNQNPINFDDDSTIEKTPK